MKIRSFATLGSLALLAAASVFGQQRLEVDIPFEFQFGKVVLPAGHYDVNRAFSNIQHVLSLKCPACKTAEIFASTSTVENQQKQATTAFVFNKYGSTYFLSTVILAGQSAADALDKSKAEREIVLRASAPPMSQVVLVARR